MLLPRLRRRVRFSFAGVRVESEQAGRIGTEREGVINSPRMYTSTHAMSSSLERHPSCASSVGHVSNDNGCEMIARTQECCCCGTT